MPKWRANSTALSTLRAEAGRRGAASVIVLRGVVRAYQLLVRPLVPPSCRFAPSCSHFALEALERHGAWRGGALALRRVARCHPWSAGGWDPVPARRR